MAANVKMRTRFARKVPAGTQCNAFGYPGTVNDTGHVVVSVPASLADVEKASGRLVVMEAAQAEKETVSTATTETAPKAEAITKK